MIKGFRIGKKSLRVHLTGWYVIVLGCTLISLRGYLYFQLRASLLHQFDINLKLASAQILDNIIIEKDNSPTGGHLALKKSKSAQALIQDLEQTGFIVLVRDSENKIIDGFGNKAVLSSVLPQEDKYVIVQHQKMWRVYSRRVSLYPYEGSLQIARSIQTINLASEHLLLLTLFSFPLILFLAAVGGWFLANQALRPIDNIIHKAESINPHDITQRIGYQGSLDEVERLATTLDQMLDRIQAAFERERHFTADASHELRTPLTVIKGQIEVALSQQRTPAEYQKTLNALEREVNRLIRLANSLLFLARLDQGNKDFSLVDVSNLLEVLMEQLYNLAEPRKIQLAEKIEPDLQVRGNSDYLTSVFLNLLDNGVKYANEGGYVHLVAFQQGEQVLVKVTNSGPGIPQEHLPHLFKRFYRVESARSRQTGGTGLGLAIAYEIVLLHGGMITVESQVNQTTTFTVYLPL